MTIREGAGLLYPAGSHPRARTCFVGARELDVRYETMVRTLYLLLLVFGVGSEIVNCVQCQCRCA